MQSYRYNTNKLRWVDDATGTTLNASDIEDQDTDNYDYDDIGNLTGDTKEEIARIEWTTYGKVAKVTRKEGSQKPDLEFTYDAQGNRTSKKTLYKVGDPRTTYYVRDAQGNVMSVYEAEGEGSLPATSEWHLYGSGRLGIVHAGGKPSSHGVGLRSYELSDHLGNVSLVLSDQKTADIMGVTGYYPFGMGMDGRLVSSSLGSRYGFNGQEKEGDINPSITSAEFWMYDSRIGLRWNIDPVIVPYVSPYATFEGNPIWYNDPKGDCPTCKGGDDVYAKGAIAENKDGKWEYQGDNKWKTIELNLGNSSSSFKAFYKEVGGGEAVDKIGDKIYERKLSSTRIILLRDYMEQMKMEM